MKKGILHPKPVVFFNREVILHVTCYSSYQCYNSGVVIIHLNLDILDLDSNELST